MEQRLLETLTKPRMATTSRAGENQPGSDEFLLKYLGFGPQKWILMLFLNCPFKQGEQETSHCLSRSHSLCTQCLIRDWGSWGS